MINFKDISYLQKGTTRQQQAFHILLTHRIMEKLQRFQPLLAGTIPLNIDITNSDLDIICCWNDADDFILELNSIFGKMEGFDLHRLVIRDELSVVAGFKADDFEVEIFGQAIPANEQLAYRHMLIEYKLLNERGEKFREEIIRLKKEGLKTEPAFAVALGLQGDPYVELLKFEGGGCGGDEI